MEKQEIKLITIKEAKILAKVSRQTIYNWIEKGYLTTYKAAGKRENIVPWLHPIEVEAFVKLKRLKRQLP